MSALSALPDTGRDELRARIFNLFRDFFQ